jgi:hypothetical protein
LVARCQFPPGIFLGRRIVTPDEIVVFAVVPQVFFLDRFRSAIAALMRDMQIITGAVQANP